MDHSGEDERPPVLARLRMPPSVLAALACPHCGGGLGPAGNALGCAGGHSFDVAREGYANLLSGRPVAGGGDDREMVRARREFQEAGHYAPLAARLAEVAARHWPGGPVADIGAGTGYYLRAVLDALPGAEGLAADASKFALRRAARGHPRAGAVGCDAWRGLPLRRAAFGLLLNVFAPRNGPEFRRVLRADGALLVVTPAPGHLAELRGPLGLIAVDPRKDERLAAGLEPHLEPEHREDVAFGLRLTRPEAAALAGMTPSARHVAPGELRDRVAALPAGVEASAAFRLSVYRPGGDA
ncbi:putative RNA methyltransferase [Actinorugispora endophytica]|uniref:23S rRNA m(1)G-748 methyltransferase n=1 Tax=Actinorugispora endophytica TaxID=1605990 RepID=A0A4R6V647_9ACTN|nr:methyltransferase type 11 [Actinorugispora endophytica]TDQ54461.1 23S rRNA m(1)G-748 methyltransferase [Actinorugispora endophytica]